MKRIFSAIVAAIILAVATISMPGKAEASSSGRALTYGILGGIAAGALIDSGIRNNRPPPPPPAYYPPPPPPPPTHDYPNCRKGWEQYWDGYQWSTRRVRICD